MTIKDYNCFEFSQEDYKEIHDTIYSKLKAISDEYSIADVLMALSKLINDVAYDFELNETQSDSHLESFLNQADVIILESLFLRGYNWLARDENGALYAYTNKPVKITLGKKGNWDNQDSSPYTCINDYPLSLAKWEDTEPIKIIEILNKI